MSSNKTEDLAAVEPLTPEQEEQIQGAGLRSFRPQLESLEDRQMLDAGLGHIGHTLPPAPPAGPAHVASAAPEVDFLPASSALPGQTTPADRRFIESQVRWFLKDK